LRSPPRPATPSASCGGWRPRSRASAGSAPTRAIGLNAAAFRAELGRATAELAEFRRQRADATLGLDTKAFKAELAAAKAELAALARGGPGRQAAAPGLGTSPGVSTRSPPSGRRARRPGARAAGRPACRVAGGSRTTEGGPCRRRAQVGAGGDQEAWQGAALNIRALMTIGMTGLVAAIVAVVPQIVLLASSLAGAAAAAGGLATAFAGAVAPALLAIVPLIGGLTKLFAAFKA
jgi:hypothetical protein